MTRIVLLFAVLAALAAMPGCLAIGADTKNTTRPTVGQELLDLKTALDRGAITQPEYDHKKADLLARG